MGNVSIDISLSNLFKSWYDFKKGKKRTKEFEEFEYRLERNLFRLHGELENKTYQHGAYRKFTVTDNKKREISVSNIKDRVVHRVLYNYLVKIFDKTFIFDIWSCRKNKGLIGAIEKTQILAKKFKNDYVWRADIKKFFDHVNHQALLKILKRKIDCNDALWLLEEVIESYQISSVNSRERERERAAGRPIANADCQSEI